MEQCQDYLLEQQPIGWAYPCIHWQLDKSPHLLHLSESVDWELAAFIKRMDQYPKAANQQ
jgi:hypothetical protein